MTLLVTGATGNVGSALVRQLCAAGSPVRALVRSPERADDLRGYDCEIAIGDFRAPGSLRDSLRGVTAAFLISPAGPDQVADETAFIDAAARVPHRPHVVKLAAMGYQEADLRCSANHKAIVEVLAGSRLPYTLIAPSSFMRNLLSNAATVQAHGALYLPAGDAAVSHVDVNDVAAVAAHVLGNPDRHAGASYVVTGPEALTYAEIARRMSVVLGRTVRYVDASEDAARQRMRAAGLAEWTIEATIESFAHFRAGGATRVTHEVQTVTGGPARDIEVFLRLHASAFRGP